MITALDRSIGRIVDALEQNGLTDNTLIIITSAYDEYAVKTYELEVLDYLVKPISFPRFLKAINRARKETDSNSSTNNLYLQYIIMIFFRRLQLQEMPMFLRIEY